MFKRSRILPAIAALLLVMDTGATPDQKAVVVDSNSLPMLLIGYGFGLSYGMESGREPTAESTPFAQINRLLEESLDQLNADVPTKLAFVREAFVIQPAIAGSRTVGTLGKSTLYVTVPVPQIKSASIVIISSVSPEATTIFQIDEHLRTKLIYDSVVASRFAGGASCEPLGQIVGIQVSPNGDLALAESNDRWSDKHRRRFLLSLANGVPQLRCSR